MQEFIGCINQTTGTYCLKVVDVGSRVFSSLVSLLPEKCGPFIQTNVTMVYNAVFQRSDLNFSIAASQIIGNCSALLPTTSSLMNCGSQVLSGVIAAADARSRTIGIGVISGIGGVTAVLLGVSAGFLIKENYRRGGCCFRLFKPKPAAYHVERAASPRPVESATPASTGESSASDVGEEALLLGPKNKKDTGCCARLRGRK